MKIRLFSSRFVLAAILFCFSIDRTTSLMLYSNITRYRCPHCGFPISPDILTRGSNVTRHPYQGLQCHQISHSIAVISFFRIRETKYLRIFSQWRIKLANPSIFENFVLRLRSRFSSYPRDPNEIYAYSRDRDPPR